MKRAIWCDGDVLELRSVYGRLDCRPVMGWRGSSQSLQANDEEHVDWTTATTQISVQFIKTQRPTEFQSLLAEVPIPMAARSKAWVCGLSLAGIAGSIPTGAWMFVGCECCVLSGRGLCDELITCPEESYRMWCVVKCDLEIS